jgi:hypothetical protein
MINRPSCFSEAGEPKNNVIPVRCCSGCVLESRCHSMPCSLGLV